jgi:hypothetical protein
MKRKILYVITSKNNMGDLALCLNWIRDLGRDAYSFGFVLEQDLIPYVSQLDACFPFEKNINVKETILQAVAEFSADALIFATNSFWNLPAHKGCKFGKFILDQGDVAIPVLSFDPFETGFNHIMPQSGHIIPFSAVPDWVYALRYMSIPPLSANARHFYSESIYNKSTLINPFEAILKWKGKTGMKSIFYPLSKDRFNFIKEHYPKYFAYLASIFSDLAEDNVQIFTILPESIPEFRDLDNVIVLPAIAYDDFLSLINASDLYLTDSYISCIVEAIQLETPSLLLMSSVKNISSSETPFFAGKVFPFWVWPYGMYNVCIEFERLFGLVDCYKKAEILNRAEVLHSIRELLFSEDKKKELINNCQKWKIERKKSLPAPSFVVENMFESLLAER